LYFELLNLILSALSLPCPGFSFSPNVPARLAHGNTSFEVIVKDKRRRECQHTRTSVPGNNLSIQRLREGSSSNTLRRCTGLGQEFSLMTVYHLIGGLLRAKINSDLQPVGRCTGIYLQLRHQFGREDP